MQPSHRTSVLVVDDGGSIRRVDGPCPQQEFFSVSQTISWQRKIPSRLQVHTAFLQMTAQWLLLHVASGVQGLMVVVF